MCSVFHAFHTEVCNQFGVPLKILRSDNAKEYLSHKFTTYLQSHGISHQSSCPYTPQQNGIAERKNRHLLDTARCLLLHMNVPNMFWSDAVLTSCYLINRMPLSTLDRKSPFFYYVSWCSNLLSSSQDFWLCRLCPPSWA